MSKRAKGTIQMVCPNPKCINKSCVWRKFDAMRDNVCKNCSTHLVVPHYRTRHAVQSNKEVKQQLRNLGEL